MTIGLIGVGKMGGGIMRRLTAAGHTVVAFDPAPGSAQTIKAAGATRATSLKKLINTLPAPRTVWLMIPAPVVGATIAALLPLLEPGGTLVDGGNSNFKDSIERAKAAAQHKINFVDVGVSGGVAGEQRGYAIMAGGKATVVKKLQPIFNALVAPEAYLHAGPHGSGHFVKMVHNAIEYGMMQAIAEGFNLLQAGPFPDIKLADVAKLWSHGTIVRSFLMELAASALSKDEKLSSLAAYVDDSGEGRWSVATAIEHAVPFWVNTAALYTRFDSRQPDSFAAKLVAALRQEFGGHSVKKK